MRNYEIRISIRNLVEFVMRSGDLDSRFVGANRMLEGSKSHQKIQKEGGKAYSAEVYLSIDVELDDILLTIDGRADGIINDCEGITIDEIKTTTRPMESIDENYNPLHWAQAKCYAYIYAVQNQLNCLFVQLTYYHIETEERKFFRKAFDFKELEEFFHSLVDKYAVWAKLSKNWRTIRDQSIKYLKFPFEEYRKGQRELAVACYKTITEEKKLFVQAPTGIGKTISTLFPAVKALGEEHISKIFYLTAKTITRQVAEDAIAKMRSKGLRFRTVTLTAKEKLCFNMGVSCSPETCEYAKGYYDRINDAIIELISNEENLTREKIEEYSLKHRVCPFEFSLDLSLMVDCIICDYNYVFDPRVYLKRFFMNNKGDYAFLIDEAHNLVDRAREMYSAELYKSSFLELKTIIKNEDKRLYKAISKINSYFVGLRKQCSDHGYLVKKQELKDLYQQIKNLISLSEEFLARNHNSFCFDSLLAIYFDSLSFLRISEFFDNKYITLVEIQNNDVKVKLFCIDPSYLLSEATKRGKTAVFFSATLAPLSYFKYILGGNDNDYSMSLSSPYDNKKLCLLTADYISTKYKNRDSSYENIVELIKQSVDKKPGNYMVYFPSYKYLNEVFGRFKEKYPDINTITQESTMSEKDRESFLKCFQPDCDKTLVAFGVLGGVFSEGIDLKGDRLIGAIIIGVGLPQLSTEQDIIMDYFNIFNSMGFEYAYIFPGMSKVLQAAGRVIRSENDCGMVLLIDERFSQNNYRNLFPEHWNHNQKVKGISELQNRLKEFWEN